MKKSFYLAVVSALMLTACTSDKDVVQPTPEPTPAVVAQQKAVGFDVYVPAATAGTRSGQAGTMTTYRLQRSAANGGGFGVYAYLVEDAIDGAGATSYTDWNRTAATKNAPNFMVNERITWNSSNQGWEYTPLKYWPNETDNDSQITSAEMEAIAGTKHLDRLSFFAYAPYSESVTDGTGITAITNNEGKLGGAGDVVEASVSYKASLNSPSDAVDLLWGVAPAGGLSYPAVNGSTVSVPEGQPLIDMTKPGVNTSMKFLFQHALARIGINVVAAIDQVGAGGTLDGNTKITVKSVKLTGKFGETGVLNLDNPKPNVANWVNINGTAITGETTALANDKTLTLSGNKIAPSLLYAGEHTFGSYSAQPTGVTTAKQDLIAGRYFTMDAIPAYSPAKQYYSDANGTVAIAKYTATSADNYFTYTSGTGVYSQQIGQIDAPASGNTTNYYHVTEGATTFEGNHELTAAVNYTKASANTYNKANLGGVNTGDAVPADYNTKVGSDPAGATLTEDEAYAYNSTLAGAKTISDVETPATYGYSNDDLPAATVLYTKVHNGSTGANTYTRVGTKSDIEWGAGNTTSYFTINPSALSATDIAFAYSGTIYDVERNYFMVVPTNNVYLNAGLSEAQQEALRTIRVQIEYYVTTEDAKVSGGRTQIKNVIEKDVVFPSLANGKSYMLNLLLGLTSVKMDAEVDEWRVINVNADLPQNTAD